MVPPLQISAQVVPEQTPALALSFSGRHLSSRFPSLLALGTVALDAPVGQEGIGEVGQMQLCNCCPIGAILVLAQPQPLLGVFNSLRDGPAFVVCPDEGGGELRGIGRQPLDLLGGPCA